MTGNEEIIKKPVYKKWWFWLIIIVVLIAIVGGTQGNNNTSQNKDNSINNSTIKEEANQDDNVPTEYKNALKKAKTYSDIMHMSKKGIYNQLTSEIEGFTEEEAQYAIDNLEN